MRTNTTTERAGTNRRRFLNTAAMVAASALAPQFVTAQRRSVNKAVAFDAFAIFDSLSAYRLAEQLFPGRGMGLSNEWRTRKLSTHGCATRCIRCTDFWRVTQDTLNYAANQNKLELETTAMMQACVKGSNLEALFVFNSAPIASRHSNPILPHTVWPRKPFI